MQVTDENSGIKTNVIIDNVVMEATVGVGKYGSISFSDGGNIHVVESGSEELDVYYNMNDDGSYFFNITKVLEPDESTEIPSIAKLTDGRRDALGYLGELISSGQVDMHDYAFFSYMIMSPAATYSFFHANGLNESAAQIALLNHYVQSNNQMVAAMLGSISDTLGSFGVTTVSWDDGTSVDLSEHGTDLDEMETMQNNMKQDFEKLKLKI